MSDSTIEQLEHFKKVMEPTPPFLEALIAEKRAHQKLRAEVEGMKAAFEGRPSPHDDYLYAQCWEYALDLVDTDLTRILEATDG